VLAENPFPGQAFRCHGFVEVYFDVEQAASLRRLGEATQFNFQFSFLISHFAISVLDRHPAMPMKTEKWKMEIEKCSPPQSPLILPVSSITRIAPPTISR
jgi:hypothetical protein